MLLRDRLNEFELDWAQAPVRSELIPLKQIRGKKVLIVGQEEAFESSIGWSFAAWNDERKAGVRVAQARYCAKQSIAAGQCSTEKGAAIGQHGAGRDADAGQCSTEKSAAEQYGEGNDAAAGRRSAENNATTGQFGGENANALRGSFEIIKKYTEEEFAPEEADYIILTGLCCREVDGTVAEMIARLRAFRQLVQAAVSTGCERILLLSDGRVYGRLGHGFAASEYEAGKTDPCAPGFEAQYLLQALESIFVSEARRAEKPFQILRTGMIYGPCISLMENPATVCATRTARGEEFSLSLTQDKNSYICIHDVLTAIQFVLTKCPGNKILNVSGRDSDVTAGELAMLLYNNFPEQCRVSLSAGRAGIGRTEAGEEQPDRTGVGQAGHANVQEEKPGRAEARQKTTDQLQSKDAGAGSETPTGGNMLNTQLIRHYGFSPAVSMEDGLIILVKSLQNTGEVFIFDNTYLGKLEKVQKILLAYLLEIDRICKKHGIKYFLAGGTLLGAVRHHGFIPWDDDADVMMLREDYDRFLQVAKDELPENIFLQLPHTEKGNYNPFTKLRIDNTMFATEFTGHFLWMHNGIFFDILAHDRTGKHRWSQKLHLMATMLMRSIVFNKWGDTDIAGGGGHPVICKIVDKVKYLVPMRFALWAQNRLLEFYKNRDTGYLYDGMGRNLSRGAFPAGWLEEVVYVDFEGYLFPVPKEYDKYLTYLYGDYMQMIPVSSRRTSHSIVLMDLGEYADFRV